MINNKPTTMIWRGTIFRSVPKKINLSTTLHTPFEITDCLKTILFWGVRWYKCRHLQALLSYIELLSGKIKRIKMWAYRIPSNCMSVRVNMFICISVV